MEILASNIGNNNNNRTNNKILNISVFLNEKCKNAININNFIDSIEVSLQQLDTTKTNGIECGITQIIMDNLSKLSVYERPIHSATKREVIYIKENDEWIKDENNMKTKKKLITKAQNKHYNALEEWRKANLDYMSRDDKQIYYAKAMSMCGKPIWEGIDTKIIKNISKQILVS